MKKRQYTLLALLGALAILMLMWGLLQPKEPIYQGKTVSLWIEDGADHIRATYANFVTLGNSADPVALANYLAPIRAYSAIKTLGVRAVPSLMRSLDSKTSSDLGTDWKGRVYVHAYQWRYLPQPIRRVLPEPGRRRYVKEFAACTLINAGILSFEEQTDLFVRLYRDPNLQGFALMMLKKNDLSDEQRELCIRKLCWDSASYREALYISDLINFKGTNLVKYYVPLLKSALSGLRQTTVCRLKDMGSNAAPALQALMITATNDSDRDIRCLAVMAIGAMGPSAKEAIPLLMSLTNAAEDHMRSAAEGAIQQIDLDAIGGANVK